MPQCSAVYITLNHERMKLLSKSATLGAVGWWLALSACLFLLYLGSLQLGFAPTDSKGLSLLGLFGILAIGFAIFRRWLKSRWDQRFEGLSLEQHLAELDKVFEEQIARGVITRAELNNMRDQARDRFEEKQWGRLGSNGSELHSGKLRRIDRTEPS